MRGVTEWKEDLSEPDWGYTEVWRTLGPFTGRGPRDHLWPDERIDEEVSDRLTQHGHLDARDIVTANLHTPQIEGFFTAKE